MMAPQRDDIPTGANTTSDAAIAARMSCAQRSTDSLIDSAFSDVDKFQLL